MAEKHDPKPRPIERLEERPWSEPDRALYFAGLNDGRMRPGGGSVQLSLPL